MKTCVSREELLSELAKKCEVIGQRYGDTVFGGFVDGNEEKYISARACARIILDLLIKYCNEMEPVVEKYALDIVNKELFRIYGNPDNGECDSRFVVHSWDQIIAAG